MGLVLIAIFGPYTYRIYSKITTCRYFFRSLTFPFFFKILKSHNSFAKRVYEALLVLLYLPHRDLLKNI